MAIDLQMTRMTVLHDAPGVDATVQMMRMTVLHDAPGVDAAVQMMRMTVLHSGLASSGRQGFQGIGLYRAEGDEQRSSFIDQRGWWRFKE